MYNTLILGYTTDVDHDMLRLGAAFVGSAIGLLALPLLIFFVVNKIMEQRKK